MPGTTEPRRLKRVQSVSRPRRAELSPELNEFLKMLKALEDQPETVIAGLDEATG